MLILTPLYTLAVEFNMVAPDSPLKYFAWIWACNNFKINLISLWSCIFSCADFRGGAGPDSAFCSSHERLPRIRHVLPYGHLQLRKSFFSVLRVFVVRLDDSREQLFRQESGPDSRWFSSSFLLRILFCNVDENKEKIYPWLGVGCFYFRGIFRDGQHCQSELVRSDVGSLFFDCFQPVQNGGTDTAPNYGTFHIHQLRLQVHQFDP